MRVEKTVAELAARERPAGCVCERGSEGMTVAWSSESFEAEMNRTCPVHGFRRLGLVMVVVYENKDRTLTENSSKLIQLLAKYRLRLSQLPKSDSDVEDDWQTA